MIFDDPSRMTTAINFLVMFIVTGLCTAQQNGGVPFTLVDMRSPGSNSITLRCRRTSDDIFHLQAQYFRNGSSVDTIEGFVNTNTESGVVTFQISRRLEGEYSCGTQLQRSNPILFIGVPNCHRKVLTMQYYEMHIVSLHCSVLPFCFNSSYHIISLPSSLWNL